MNHGHAFDIVISGGGLVGMSLACALEATGLKIAIVEKKTAKPLKKPNHSNRTLALTLVSKQILTAIGVWELLEQSAFCPIKSIHVSNRGHFGMTTLDHREMGVSALGYTVPAQTLEECLYQQISRSNQISLLRPAAVEVADLESGPAGVSVTVVGEKRTHLLADLLVVAEGGDSKLRDHLGFTLEQRAYPQLALVTNVEVRRNNQGVAFERFTSSGAIALLPLSGKEMAVIWTLPLESAERMMALSDSRFLDALQKEFGYRAGVFVDVTKRALYPLTCSISTEMTKSRVAIMGNAAHTVHPVAGQGFNLGLGDAASLAEIIAAAKTEGVSLGDPSVLSQYAKWRQPEVARVSRFTDGLIKVFASEIMPIVVGRNLAMSALDITPGLKRRFLSQAMGFGGRVSKLSRGRPLQ